MGTARVCIEIEKPAGSLAMFAVPLIVRAQLERTKAQIKEAPCSLRGRRGWTNLWLPTADARTGCDRSVRAPRRAPHTTQCTHISPLLLVYPLRSEVLPRTNDTTTHAWVSLFGGHCGLGSAPPGR